MTMPIYLFVAGVTVMLWSLLVAVFWAAAVHDGKLKLQGVRMARLEFSWKRFVRDECISVRDRTLSWASGEFHDGAGQILSVTRSAMLGNLFRKSRRQLVRETLSHAQMLKGCVEDVRQLSHSLSGTLVQREGFSGALQSHLSYVGTVYELAWELHFPDGEPALNPEVGQKLFRIVQECLHNTARHARASRVSVRVSVPAPGLLTLEVADDGVGVSEGAVITGSGMGLAGIRERVWQLGGSVVITTGHQKGFHLSITINTLTC